MYYDNYEKTWREKYGNNCSRGLVHCYCFACKEEREDENNRRLKYEEERKINKEIRDYNNETNRAWR